MAETTTTNANAPAQTTPLGVRMIALYITGGCGRAALDAAYYRMNWIGTEDYLAAIA